MTSGGTKVQTIMPSEPPGSKRKVVEDPNLSGLSSKKPRKESKPPSRRVNGERIQGGLVIVREASAVPSSQPPPSKTSTVPPSSQSAQSHPSSQTKPRSHSRPPSAYPAPPLKKYRTDDTPLPPPQSSYILPDDLPTYPFTPSRPRTPAPPLYDEYTAPVAGHGDADADITAMNTEADLLRSQTRSRSRPTTAVSSQSSTSSAGAAMNPEFTLPARTPTRTPGDKRARGKRRDEEPGSVRRRASMSARGKRVSSSYDTSAQPHPSVSHTSFYKHVDADLPEPLRARQLLIWCASRAMDTWKDPPVTPSAPAPALPTLDLDAMRLLRGVQAQVIRMLAQKKIDTNVFSDESAPGRATPRKSLGAKKENAQNVENRAREVAFKREIERAQAEEQTWIKAGQYYDTLRASALVDADRRVAAAKSERARGKMRAGDACAEGSWASPRAVDLPPRLGGDSIKLARKVLTGEGGGENELRMAELAYRVDVLRNRVFLQLHRTHRAQESIDARFAALSLASRRLPNPSPPSSTGIPPLPPPVDRPVMPDARNLLRALAAVDSRRAPEQVSEAVRLTRREVQRADGAAAASQPVSVPVPQTPRKGTSGVPPTPGRRAGTPGRRATTPGRTR